MVGGGGGGGGGGGHGGGGGGGGGSGGHGGGGGHGGHSHGGGGVFVAPTIGFSSRSSTRGTSSMADEEAPLLDESYQTYRTRMEYFGVCAFMLLYTGVSVYSQWPDWHNSLVVVITYSYSTAMALLLVKHCNTKQERREDHQQCAPQSTQVLMLVFTGIMVISLALAVSIFHNKPVDVAQFMFFSVLCATLSFCLSHGMARDGSENSCA